MSFRRAIVVLGIGMLAQYSTVFASPIFSLDTQADWQNALNSGQVSEVTTFYDALNYYGTAGVDYALATPSLAALNNAQSGMGDGLLMAWGDETNPLPQVAAWEYTYGVDPDLTGTLLSLGVTPPNGILSVSLTLTDNAFGWMSWFWDVLPPGPGPSGVLAGVPTILTLDPTLQANQANSTAFIYGGFNHTIAISIIADELVAAPGATWTSFPSAPIVTGQPVWNYWTSLSVSQVPVPAAVWLFGSGLAALIGIARRKKL